MSDHSDVLSARRAEKPLNQGIITHREYLEMRLQERGATLVQMVARGWAEADDVIKVLNLAKTNCPSLMKALLAEAQQLLESDYLRDPGPLRKAMYRTTIES